MHAAEKMIQVIRIKYTYPRWFEINIYCHILPDGKYHVKYYLQKTIIYIGRTINEVPTFSLDRKILLIIIRLDDWFNLCTDY